MMIEIVEMTSKDLKWPHKPQKIEHINPNKEVKWKEPEI